MSAEAQCHPLPLDTVLRLSAEDAGRRFGCRLLDLRGGPTPPADHLPGSAWLPDALTEGPHASLLPARQGRIVLLHDDPTLARQKAQELAGRGWDTAYLATPFPAHLAAPGPPQGALWAPDPYLERRIAAFDPRRPGVVLDLGCGSGRESVYLAHRGFRVVGLDRLPDALDLARRRAILLGVRPDFETRRLVSGEDLPEGEIAGVICLRFWAPGVLAGLHRRLGPGAFLVLRVYGPAAEQGGGRGPRRPRHRTSAEEVRRVVGSAWQWLDGPTERSAEEGGWVEGTARRSGAEPEGSP